jgi:lipopolysaccharide transport system permease protein
MPQLSSDPGTESSRTSSRRPAIFRNFHLFRKLVARDLTMRFTGSVLGLAWAVLQPLTLVALYWFVFTNLIGGGPGRTNPHYVEFLIAGLLPWLGISEGIMRSTTSILDNAPLVRKLPLNSGMLVLVPNASALVFQGIGLAIFVAVLIGRGTPPRALWLLPVALALQFALQSGMGLILATTHVFFRDVTHVVGFALSIIFYLSPILYPVVGRFESFFAWNPLTPLLGLYRRSLLAGIPEIGSAAALPAMSSFVYLTAVAVAILIAGSALMQRAQPDLVDLI